MTRIPLILFVAMLSAAPSALPQEPSASRNRTPYAGIDWARLKHVTTTSHGHIGAQADLDRAYAGGIRFFTISNYYPSAPWCPMKDMLAGQFKVRQDHANVVKGTLTPGPFAWNDIIMDPQTGWGAGLPDEQKAQLPFNVGGPVFTNIPSDILEAPNAEHHSFTDTRIHVCTPGSAFRSGNFDARSRFQLQQHGYAMGVGQPWREGFKRILGELVVPDGGGIIINHPVWSKLPNTLILELLDHDARVLGIEVYNHGCVLEREDKSYQRNEEVWDAVLSTGRQCFGFFVPDHQIESNANWEGRNVLLAAQFGVEDCLRAYRRGTFYGALKGNGLQFTEIASDNTVVRVKTNGATKIEFISEKGVVSSVAAAEAEFQLPKGAGNQPDITFVRAKAYDDKGETLFSQPMLYRTEEEVAKSAAAQTATRPDSGEAGKTMTKFDYAKLTNPVWRLPDMHLRDPAVLVHDGLIYIFFTYYDPKAVTWHIAMSTTEDFLTFSPIEIISPEGYASPGNVIRTNKGWTLCYQQYREFPHYLCLAFSEDLHHWSEPKKIFNTGPENMWNVDKRVIDPFLVEWKGTYYCYYIGSTRWGKPSGHNLIGVCASEDLETWRDLSPDKPVIGVDFDWEQPDGNENNCVIRYKDRWFMLYSAGLKDQKIAYAWSDDLVHWEKGGLCDVPVLDASKTGFGAPVIIEGLAGPGTFHMLYQGRDDKQHMSFILLESSDLIHWK